MLRWTGSRAARRVACVGTRATAALVVVALALVLTAAASATSASPKPGAPCKHAGRSAKTSGGKRLRCTRRGHKVVWLSVKTKRTSTRPDTLVRLGGVPLTHTQAACLQKALGAAAYAKLAASGKKSSLTPAQRAKTKACLGSAIGSSPGGSQQQGSGPGSSQQQGYARVGDGDSSAKNLPACSGTALLDHLPTSDVSSIEPLGHTNGEHILPVQADHIYLYPSAGGPAPTVYAPGNVTLLQVVSQTHKGADAWLGTDYSVAFSPCRSTMFIYGHMTSISSRIQAALNGATPTCETGTLADNCIYADLSLALASGETMGTALPPTSGLDFGATDVRTPTLAFLHPTTVTGGVLGDSYTHAVCPLDYFVASIKSALYAKLQTKNAGANGIPACGAVMQDKPGTSQGNWYQPGTTQTNQGNGLTAILALAHYNLDPTQAVLSAGSDLLPSKGFGSQIFYAPSASGLVNPDPSRITPDGQVYCIEGLVQPAGSESGHVDLTMPDATTLKADYAQGDCAATPTLSAAAVTYNR